MKILRLVVIVAVTFLSASVTWAGTGWSEINASGLKNKMETVDPLVIFPLSIISFNNLHIKGSVHIPMGELKDKLPKDKNQHLVFYCLGRQ